MKNWGFLLVNVVFSSSVDEEYGSPRLETPVMCRIPLFSVHLHGFSSCCSYQLLLQLPAAQLHTVYELSLSRNMLLRNTKGLLSPSLRRVPPIPHLRQGSARYGADFLHEVTRLCGKLYFGVDFLLRKVRACLKNGEELPVKPTKPIKLLTLLFVAGTGKDWMTSSPHVPSFETGQPMSSYATARVIFTCRYHLFIYLFLSISIMDKVNSWIAALFQILHKIPPKQYNQIDTIYMFPLYINILIINYEHKIVFTPADFFKNRTATSSHYHPCWHNSHGISQVWVTFFCPTPSKTHSQ